MAGGLGPDPEHSRSPYGAWAQPVSPAGPGKGLGEERGGGPRRLPPHGSLPEGAWILLPVPKSGLAASGFTFNEAVGPRVSGLAARHPEEGPTTHGSSDTVY